MTVSLLGPILAALLAGVLIFYLFRLLQDSDRSAVQKFKNKR
jgi:hypothetical protein